MREEGALNLLKVLKIGKMSFVMHAPSILVSFGLALLFFFFAPPYFKWLFTQRNLSLSLLQADVPTANLCLCDVGGGRERGHGNDEDDDKNRSS